MSNFSVLSQHDEQLLRLGMLAEKYFPDDPNTCLIKLRQLGESLAQLLAARSGLYVSPDETQHDLLRRLQDGGILPREIFQIFNEVRRAGNAASHALSGDHRTALMALKLSCSASAAKTRQSSLNAGEKGLRHELSTDLVQNRTQA